MTAWVERSVLVTGGAGFIGHRLVRKLADLGANVTVVDDLSKGEATNLDEVLNRIHLIKNSLLDSRVARKLLQNVDICFHLAARIGASPLQWFLRGRRFFQPPRPLS